MKVCLAIVIALFGFVCSASAEPVSDVQQSKDDVIIRLLKRTTPPATLLLKKSATFQNRVQLVRLLTPKPKKAMLPALLSTRKQNLVRQAHKSSTLIRVGYQRCTDGNPCPSGPVKAPSSR